MAAEERWGRLVHEKYEQLGFKLQRDIEWTVVAGIILNGPEGESRLVALGSGVKCLPARLASREPLRYQLVRDSHAEVLARRAFIVYLYHQLVAVEAGRPSILQGDREGGFRVQDGHWFGMYTSQAPCGDASMHLLPPLSSAPQSDDSDRRDDEGSQLPGKRSKLLRGRDHVRLRGLRTKPGRADSPPCESMSCTDKIALWNAIGWQGAILGTWLREPIRVRTLVVAEAFDQAALEESIVARSGQAISFLPYAGKPFRHGQAAVRARLSQTPVPASVAQAWYWDGSAGQKEVICDGRKLGAGRPNSNEGLKPKCQSMLSTESLLRTISSLGILPVEGSCVEVKMRNQEYQIKKAKLLAPEAPFADWIQSDPSLREFRISLLR